MRLGRRNFVQVVGGGVGSLIVAGCQSEGPNGAGDSLDGDDSSSGGPMGSSGQPSDDEGGTTDDGADDGSGETGTDDGMLDIPDLLDRTPVSVTKSSRVEVDLALTVIDGKVPSDIHGHYFMVCAMPWQDGTFIINGDGMVYRLDFGDREIRLKTRLLRTPCFYAEKAVAGTDAAFTNPGGGAARISTQLGVRNQINTALVPMGTDRLLATFDAGRPFEIDPVTLEIATAVGYHSEWRPGLEIPLGLLGSTFPLTLTSAHPCFDPHTKELFTVNYGQGGLEILGMSLLGETFTRVMRWDGESPTEHWNLVDAQGQPVKITMSAHQMQITELYVVLQDSAFSIEPAKLFDPNAFTPQPTESTFWVVRRADLDSTTPGGNVLATKIVIPRESPHFMVDYVNPSGRLTVHLVHNTAYDASEWLGTNDRLYGSNQAVRQDILGMLTGTTDLGSIGRYVMDVDAGQVLPDEIRLMSDDTLTWGVTLFTHRGTWTPDRHDAHFWIATGFFAELLLDRVVPAYADHPYRSVSLDALPYAEGRPVALFRCNPTEGSITDGYAFPKGRLASSPQFIPRQGGTDGATDGYIVCTVVSDDIETAGSSGDEFWIFDANDLSRGPLCRLGHVELNMPYTLHTTWLPEIGPRTAEYRVDVVTDHAEEVAKLSSELQHLFAEEVYPHFI